MMVCKIIGEDGWYVEARTFTEARSTVIDMLQETAELSPLEADALFDHDVDCGNIHIIHPTKGTARVH